MRIDAHLCLVSKQTTPNIVPLLDEEQAPRKVALVVTPEMKDEAAWLSEVIRRRGMKVERIEVPDATDYFAMADQFVDWLSRQEEARIALNLTGGNKLMALAAQAAFQAARQPVFYVDAATDKVLWLGERRSSKALPAKIRMREYLEIHGYLAEMSKPQIPARLRDLAEDLVRNAKAWGPALGTMNSLAHSAKGNFRTPPLPTGHGGNKFLQEVTALFAEADLLKQEEGRLVFPGEEARQFVNGGWFEFHVYRILSDLAPKLNLVDYATNLKVLAPDGKTRNEIDAAFMQGNRLHLIECKTANLSALSERGDSKATDAIYKLEYLSKIGGDRTGLMLVDYRGGLSPADHDRARHSNIQVISAAALPNLKERLIKWIADHPQGEEQ